MDTSTFDFGFDDADYWAKPALKHQISKLWDLERDTIVLGAPKRVAIDKLDTLPVILVRACSYAELAAMNMTERALVVAVDLDSYELEVATLVRRDDLAPAKPSARPPLDGQTSDIRRVDLRAALELDWRPARLLVTVIVRDLVTNRAPIELGKAPGAYEDPAVAEYLASLASRHSPPRIWPPVGVPLPRYERLDDSPPIPDEPGIAVAVERVVVGRPGARAVLRGSFRVAVPEHARVREPWPDADPSQPQPSAVLRLAVVVTASDEPGAAVEYLEVPSYDELDEDEPVATGYFALDLLATELIGPEAQTYFVFVFCGPHMSGPTPAAIVSEAMLPR